MAFLIVAGTTVPVAANSATMTQEEVGDRHRAFDGTYRSTVRSYPREWKLKTSPMLSTTAETFRGVLNNSTQPQACSGNIFNSTGTVDCDTQLTDMAPLVTSTGTSFGHVVLSITLRESS